MTTRPAPLVHVGVHRAGSTWLQRSVFRAATGGFGDVLPNSLLFGHLIEPPGTAFDACRAAEAFAAFLDAAAEARRGERGRRVPVVSQERLTGYPHAGGRDAGELADRVCAALPDARVLIVTREQRAITRSCYRLYVKIGGPLRPGRYVRPLSGSTTRIPGFDLRQFDFHLLIERYRRHLGDDRVLALPFEHLAEDPSGFVHRIADFAGAEPPGAVDHVARNAGLRGVALSAKRRANRYLIRHPLNPMGRSDRDEINAALLRWATRLGRIAPASMHERVERELDETVERAVAEQADRIAESNRRASELMDLDLGALGYLT